MSAESVAGHCSSTGACAVTRLEMADQTSGSSAGVPMSRMQSLD
jgi:hypothetical protein